jgi:hypothetical protein
MLILLLLTLLYTLRLGIAAPALHLTLMFIVPVTI